MKYILTSTAWSGQITLEYDQLGLIEKFDLTTAELSESQRTWFLRNLPRELAELQRLIEKAPSATLTVVPGEITFDTFWNRYGEKDRSSKKKARARWDRMSDADRVKAFNFIRKYENNMQAWQTKMYAETYLNKELWNN